MATQTAPTEQKPGDTTRDEAFAEADRLIALGVPIKRACEQAGIPRISYYRRLEKEKAESPAKESRPDDLDGRSSIAEDATRPATPGATGTPTEPGHKEA